MGECLCVRSLVEREKGVGMRFYVLLSLTTVLAAVADGAAFVSVQPQAGGVGIPIYCVEKAQNNPSKDPLVNEQKIKEFLSDPQVELRKQINILEIYRHRRYVVSDELSAFLIRKLQDVQLTAPILRLLMESGCRYEADELACASRAYVDARLDAKDWPAVDEYVGILRACTPSSGARRGHCGFDGYDPALDLEMNRIWEKSDAYLEYFLKGNPAYEVTYCSRKMLSARYGMLLGKIRADGGGITKAVLALYDADKNPTLLAYTRKEDVSQFLALLDNRDVCLSGKVRSILELVLHVEPGTNVKQWWEQNGVGFSFKARLLEVAKDKRASLEQRYFTLQQICNYVMQDDAEYDKAYLKDVASVIGDTSEPDNVRIAFYGMFASIGSGKPGWEEIAEPYTATLLGNPNCQARMALYVDGKLINGIIREKFTKISGDKRNAYPIRALMVDALARGCEAHKNDTERRREDARQALTVLKEIPDNGAVVVDWSKSRTKAERMAVMSATSSEECRARRIIFGALEKMTGRTDCGYDIKKWRQVVGELEARAMLGVDGGQ